MNIDEMPAGREFDALIAEAFGYKAWLEKRGEWNLCVVQKPGSGHPWEVYRRSCWEQEKLKYSPVSCLDAARIGFFGTGFPEYSTDIAATWEVVERMRSEKWYFAFYDMQHCWAIDIDHPNCPHVEARAKEFSLALCRAALKAVGVS